MFHLSLLKHPLGTSQHVSGLGLEPWETHWCRAELWRAARHPLYTRITSNTYVRLPSREAHARCTNGAGAYGLCSHVCRAQTAHRTAEWHHFPERTRSASLPDTVKAGDAAVERLLRGQMLSVCAAGQQGWGPFCPLYSQTQVSSPGQGLSGTEWKNRMQYRLCSIKKPWKEKKQTCQSRRNLSWKKFA